MQQFPAITEKLQQYTYLKEWACKNMATDNSLNNTTCAICNRYYSEQITQNYKASYSLPWSKDSNAESSNN